MAVERTEPPCAGGQVRRTPASDVGGEETPNGAAHSLGKAFSSMASNTGCRSPGELEMTLQHFRGCRLLLQQFGQIIWCAGAVR